MATRHLSEQVVYPFSTALRLEDLPAIQGIRDAYFVIQGKPSFYLTPSSEEPFSEEPVISSEELVISSEEPVIVSSPEPVISSEEPVISSLEPVVSSEEPEISSPGEAGPEYFCIRITTVTTPDDFILQTDNAVDLKIVWGDGADDTYNGTGLRTHAYADAGTYDICFVSGTATRIAFGEAGCTPTLVKAILTPVRADLGLISALKMFKDCTALDTFVANWFNAASANITIMSDMFYGAILANPDVSGWDTGLVTDMRQMFRGTVAFNQSVDNWDVSSCQQMYDMFRTAVGYNQPMGNWVTSSLINISRMFYQAALFDQDVSQWDMTNVTSASTMMTASGFSQANYDKLLSLTTGWPSQAVNDSIVFSAGTAKYDDESADIANGRAHLVDALPADHAWVITDGGPD